MMEKRGMLTAEKSHCDFDSTKKVAFYDADSNLVASLEHRDKLLKPVPLQPVDSTLHDHAIA